MTEQSHVLGISLEQRQSALSDLAFFSGVFDALTTSIAVVDSYGTIVAVNASWRRFGEANGLRHADYCVGVNYFAVCRAAVEPAAREAYAGIHDVLSGARRSFSLVYPCHSPDEKRWFMLRATPMVNYPGFLVLAHEDITERVRAEKALENRMANGADASR